MNMQDKGKAVLTQFKTLKEIRTPFDQSWRDCYDYTDVSLGGGFHDLNDAVSEAQRARSMAATRLDTTGVEGTRLLASSTSSSLTPPSTRWFHLALNVNDEEALPRDAKQWLEDAAARVHNMVHGSNFDSESIEFMTHIMVAGMAGLYVEIKDGRFYFQVWPLNHLYVQETLNKGYIDTVYRQFAFTVQQAVLEFGLDKLPEHMQESYKSNPNDQKKFVFVVAIRPRIIKGVQASGSTAKNMPWESLWVAPCGTVVRERGYHEMPVIVPRWKKIPDTDYARGPVFDALPDIKMLFKIKESMLQNMDMHIAGMFKIKDDGTINVNNMKFGARRVFPVNNMDDIQPLKSGGDIQFATLQISNLQQSIRSVLLANQLGPTDKAIQTATEVQTRNNQVRQILGPIFARLQSEYLSPLITRVFGLALRAGLLPEMPQALIEALQASGQELDIEYRSPLARSQKMQELQAVDSLIQKIAATAQAKPDLWDHVNFDAVVQKYGDLLAVDPALLNDDEAIRKTRAARQKQMQEQQAQALAQQAIQTAQEVPQAEVSPVSPPF